jgi:hypothetical protein
MPRAPQLVDQLVETNAGGSNDQSMKGVGRSRPRQVLPAMVLAMREVEADCRG